MRSPARDSEPGHREYRELLSYISISSHILALAHSNLICKETYQFPPNAKQITYLQ
jgi:hypothetical protein